MEFKQEEGLIPSAPAWIRATGTQGNWLGGPRCSGSVCQGTHPPGPQTSLAPMRVPMRCKSVISHLLAV